LKSHEIYHKYSDRPAGIPVAYDIDSVSSKRKQYPGKEKKMRPSFLSIIIITAALSIFLFNAPMGVNAKESRDSGERFDLPDELPKIPLPPPEDDVDDTDEPEPPDEEPVPPIEFFDTPIETDTVVYVVDRTGSMSISFTGRATDLEGEMVYGKTKMWVTKTELKRSIMNLSSNIKFNISFYSHLTLGGSGPDVIKWQGCLVNATDSNKAAAFSWIDVKGNPSGWTPISDGTVQGGLYFDTSTIILLTDGWPNVFQGQRYSDLEYSINRTITEIRVANTDNTTIHTFFIPFGDESKDARCRHLMQTIAAQNGPGTYTEVGG